MTPQLSVVIPVYNEAPHLAATIDRLVDEVSQSGFDTELIVVDDGSTDTSADAVRAALGDRLPLSLVEQPNRGRFEAVRAGLQRAGGDSVLILGARVRLHPGGLAFVKSRQAEGDNVWTGHVHIDTAGNPFGTFMNTLTEIAWSDYFAHPRTASFGLEEFDRYPKGSGCFVAPRDVLLDAFDVLPTRYAEPRHANDDTPMLRRIAASHRIHVSPSFAAEYVPRTTFSTFIRHTVHRGTVFLDGHGRRESRFFPHIVAFYPVSAAVLVALVLRPRLIPLAVAATSVVAGAIAAGRRRSRSEVATVALVSPAWAVAMGAGLWRGLGLIVRGRALDGKGVQR
jgi:glycosyltransferase involved in cell wall biosynthesis